MGEEEQRRGEEEFWYLCLSNRVEGRALGKPGEEASALRGIECSSLDIFILKFPLGIHVGS